MVGSQGPQVVGEHVTVLIGGLNGLPRLAHPSGESGASVEGVGVVGSQDPQQVVEQIAELFGGLGWLPGLALHVGEVGTAGHPRRYRRALVPQPHVPGRIGPLTRHRKNRSKFSLSVDDPRRP